ncbi:MAG: ribosome biogenesis GTPase Der [Deltaproteobacteria bacterium GWA2_54_12]|nr:MAG: ribosome biogenesis GTPase Der [Deltaproteobacteria bacterium GWA2_54_12]
MKPIVAVVGRPNVGKSTLFNKLLGKKKAIVHDQPGVTRDLNYADTEEMGRAFTLVDTGGFEPDAGNIITKQVRDQARLAIEDADVIVFVMDARAGLIPQDEELVDMLRRAGKPVIYVANKIDTPRQAALVADFYSLGVDEIMGVSAEHGLGITELIDEILRRLPEREEVPVDEDRIKVAIVGRPNVGKSSLLNRLIGKSRAIVSDIAGTTRDSVDTPVDMDGGKYLFIDTAGIRKKSKVSLTVESYSVMEAIRSIERCDVALLLVDGKEGVSTQDEKIAGLIEDRKKCCAVIVNKWDLAPEKDTHTVEYAKETIRQKLPFIAYAPVLFTSALTGQRVPKVLETVNELFERGRSKASTSALNSALESIVARKHPPASRGREVKFYYMTQVAVLPPTFLIFCNHPDGVEDSYVRFLTSALREAIGMEGIPLKVIFKQRH